MTISIPEGGRARAGNPGAAEANDLSLQVSRFIAKPASAAAYSQSAVGPETTVEIEPSQHPGVDGSNKLLRSLSPFVIRLEPPLVYASHPAALDKAKTNVNPGIYDSAAKSAGRDGFFSARAALGNTEFATANFNGRTPEEFVASSSGRRFTRDSPGASRDNEGASSGNFGKPTIADLYQAIDIATQLNTILKTPPLVLLINPQTLSMSRVKIQQFQERTRFGYVFQAWGEEQPKLSIQVRCGAFYSAGRGLQFASRRDSAAWQNTMALFHFYKNNGYLYDTIGKSNAHHFVGAISIHYDGWSYFGHFESFTFGLDDTNVHGGVNFDMEFTVSRMVDHDEPVAPDGELGVVRPLNSPIPNPNDPRFRGPSSRAVNPAGEFRVGIQESSVVLFEQGNVVAGGAEASRIRSPDPEVSPPPPPIFQGSTGAPELPVGGSGFRTPDEPVADPQAAAAAAATPPPSPFGV